jgi:septum site-determining protein MinC
MGKRAAEKSLYPAAGWASDESARLKRLTRAELIRLITKPETQSPISERERCIDEKPITRHAPIMLVNGSVRSGQIVRFEEGDLIIVGSVGSGAEVVAGGSIHIYGALRGRAYAGTSDQFGGRIFCQKLEAELLAIGGLCRMSDEFDSDLRGCPAHAWRDANDIQLGALYKLETQSKPESTDVVASLGQNRAPIEKAQGSACAPAQYSAAARFSWARPLSWARRLTSVTPRSACWPQL